MAQEISIALNGDVAISPNVFSNTKLESDHQLQQLSGFDEKHVDTLANDLIDLTVAEPLETLIAYDEPAVDDGKSGLASTVSKSAKPHTLREMLNTLLPPRVFLTEDGTRVKQCVSSRKAEREDVVALQAQLDERLQQRQARESGICPVREQLYAQVMDELIRQATIERPERGLVLLRVRDEIRMTIAAYRTLYQSSISFGMRKALQAEQGNVDLANKIQQLSDKKKALQLELQKQRSLSDTVEKRKAEKRYATEKKQQEEKEFLKFQAQHLEAFLKTV